MTTKQLNHQELTKRWEAACDEILSHKGKPQLWHEVSEDARALHWAWHLEDYFKANPIVRPRVRQEGPADAKGRRQTHFVIEKYQPSASYFWAEMVTKDIRDFMHQKVDLDDLPPSFTDPFDDGPARFRSNEEILATGHPDAKPMLDEFDRLKRNRLADAVSKSINT
jgi:hypothetical protein